ncbi:MAG: DEAD/DEAH box helicase, partial [Bacteroidota bacterium]
LVEKVINKKSLIENTFVARVGEEIDMEFIAEILLSYDFERTDFVYEPGQFAIRGGIFDIFSYSGDLPFRLEFFGNEIESIRTFSPETQLSIENLKFISIIPNVQTKLLQEVRESFLDYLPENTCLWIKDIEQVLDVTARSFEKVQENFDSILEQSGDTQVISNPEVLFETVVSLQKQIEQHQAIEFGSRYHYPAEVSVQFQASPQPSFNKNFDLLVEHIAENQAKNIQTVIVSDSFRQTERLRTILHELDPFLKIQTMALSLRQGFLDKNLNIAYYTDHQIFERYHRYKTKEKHSKSKALTLKELRTLKPGDYVTHIDYGIGRFAGMEKVDINGKQQEAIRLIYRDDDLLYVNIHSLHKISKYSGTDGTIPNISKLGSPEWENKKKRIKRRVQDIAEDLISLYAKRKGAPGFAFSKDSYLQMELESSFIYEDTPDQAKATQHVKDDMELEHPMDRLVCGDVGFGKTEVAIRAAFKAVCDNKQVAVLVPTTILAMQHYRTFKERLKDFPCNVDYVNRFKSTSAVRESMKKLNEGKTDIMIGTHRLVGKDVKFKNLGLLIIDEEQK